MHRSKRMIGILAVVPAALLSLTQLADAHHPELEASVKCVDSQAEVTVKAWSWEDDDANRRVNKDIAISWDGVTKGSGAFTSANDYSFSTKFSVPADGTKHTATATAMVPFGPNGEFGFAGEFRQVTVTLPANCAPAPTTTTAPPPTTTVDTVVLGTVAVRAEVATPVEVLPRFAG
jgi:hypothetical protein